MSIEDMLDRLPKQVVLSASCLSKTYQGPNSYMPNAEIVDYPARYGVSIDEMPMQVSESVAEAYASAYSAYETKMKYKRKDERTLFEKADDLLIYELYKRLLENGLVKEDDHQFHHAKEIYDVLPTVHDTQEYWRL